MKIFDVTVLDQKHGITAVIRNVPAETKAAAFIKARRLMEIEGVPRQYVKRKKEEEVKQDVAKAV
jgi:hypothetical protein